MLITWLTAKINACQKLVFLWRFDLKDNLNKVCKANQTKKIELGCSFFFLGLKINIENVFNQVRVKCQLRI